MGVVHRALEIVAFILLCLVATWVATAGRAFAATAELTWTHPTQRELGEALPLSEIAGYDLTYGLCGQDEQTVRVGVVQSHTLDLGDPAYGEWCFKVRTVDTDGLLSAYIGPVTKIIKSPPKPPEFSVVNIVAYEVRWNPGRGTVLGKAVGTVPVGTACGESRITTQGQREYREVPLDAVDLMAMPQSAIVVAECEASS